MSVRAIVGVLWACLLVRGAFYACLVPLWEGYDEWAHYAFLEHLANSGRLPDPARDHISREVQESMRLVPMPWGFRDQGYLTHDDYWKLPPQERARRERELRALPSEWSRQPAAGGPLIYEALQPPLYYWPTALLLRLVHGWPLPSRVLLLRLWGVAIASFLAPLTFLLARRVFRHVGLAIGAAAVVVAMPELLIDVGRVGNEPLAIVLFTLLIYLCAGRHTMWVGVALGLGLLTKVYFLTALVAVAGIFVWGWWTRRASAIQGLLALGVALAISGWWYARNLVVTGTLSGLSEAVMLRKMTLAGRLAGIWKVRWIAAADSIALSHIWFGGWSGLQVRSWMYHFFYWVAAAAAAGLAVKLWRRGGHGLGVLLSFYGLFWAGQAYNVLLLFLSKGASTSMGWYLYAVVAAEVLLAAAGLLRLAPAALRAWVLPAGAAAFALLDLYTVHFLLLPYYTGLIAHKPSGALAAFHLSQLPPLGEVLSRAPAMVACWALYLLATAACVAVAAAAHGVTLELGEPISSDRFR